MIRTSTLESYNYFGFRVVTPKSNVWHGFARAGGRSLCGRVPFGPERRYDLAKGRPCARCADIWHRAYPKATA